MGNIEGQDRPVGWLNSSLRRFGNGLKFFKPIAGELKGPIKKIYVDEGNSEAGVAASVALARLFAGDVDSLVEFVLLAEPRQLKAIADRLNETPDLSVNKLVGHLSAPEPADLGSPEIVELAQKKARCGIALCLMGQPEEVWRFLRFDSFPDLRTYLVHGMAECGVDWRLLHTQLSLQTDAGILSAMVVALGDYDSIQLPASERASFFYKLLGDLYTAHSQVAVRSAAEWILRSWGRATQLSGLKEKAVSAGGEDPGKDWYVTKGEDFTMAVLEGPLEFQMGTPSAESIKELGKNAG